MWRLKFRASLPLIRTSLVEKISMVNQLNNMDIRCKDMNSESLLLVIFHLIDHTRKQSFMFYPNSLFFCLRKTDIIDQFPWMEGRPVTCSAYFPSVPFAWLKGWISRNEYSERKYGWIWICPAARIFKVVDDFTISTLINYHASNSVRFSQADINCMCVWKYSCLKYWINFLNNLFETWRYGLKRKLKCEESSFFNHFLHSKYNWVIHEGCISVKCYLHNS